MNAISDQVGTASTHVGGSSGAGDAGIIVGRVFDGSESSPPGGITMFEKVPVGSTSGASVARGRWPPMLGGSIAGEVGAQFGAGAGGQWFPLFVGGISSGIGPILGDASVGVGDSAAALPASDQAPPTSGGKMTLLICSTEMD